MNIKIGSWANASPAEQALSCIYAMENKRQVGDVMVCYEAYRAERK